jgi:hypothetical protein
MNACTCLITGCLGLLSVVAPARATAGERDELDTPEATPVRDSVAAGQVLPYTIGARVDAQRALAWGLAGHDGSRRSAIMEATTEVRLLPFLALRGGAVYTQTDGGRARPSGGLRAQALRQAAHGVDASVAVAYRPEGFTEPEGELEAVLAVARRFGRLGAFANVAYGQDPEGHERDAEARIATLWNATTSTSVGVDARVRTALGTSPAGTTEPRLDVAGGPLAVIAIGPVALLGQVGASALRLGGGTAVGVLALGGVAASF